MNGILLSGGHGTRLRPLTSVVSKQLLPIYDKPMIYYPLTTLILSGAREIIVVISPNFEESYANLLGDGSHFGISIKYIVQNKPTGIPDVFNLTRNKFSLDLPCTLMLGDNFLFGPSLGQNLFHEVPHEVALIHGYEVENPESYGVVEIESEVIRSIEEKPQAPKSNLAITGLYRFPTDVFDKAQYLQPSSRNETEIVDLINLYNDESRLRCQILPRGSVWLDTGTPSSLLAASNFVSIVQERQGLLIGSPHEAAWRLGLITDADLINCISQMCGTSYGSSLEKFVNVN